MGVRDTALNGLDRRRSTQIGVAAAARELVGFRWAVMRDVAEHQPGGVPT